MTKKPTTLLLAILGTVVVLCVVFLAAALMFINSIVHQQDADAPAASTAMNAARETFRRNPHHRDAPWRTRVHADRARRTGFVAIAHHARADLGSG